MVTADDYASLIDPTRPYLSRGRRKPRRGWNPRTLAQARDAGLASANDATAPGSRYHNAPLTLAYEKGPTGTHSHPTEPTGPDPWILLTQVSESTGFLRWFKVMAARQGRGEASDRGGGRAKV